MLLGIGADLADDLLSEPLPLVLIIDSERFAGTLFDQNEYVFPDHVVRLIEPPQAHGWSSYGPPHYRRWPHVRSTYRPNKRR